MLLYSLLSLVAIVCSHLCQSSYAFAFICLFVCCLFACLLAGLQIKYWMTFSPKGGLGPT